ncbi:MAG TPA: nucleotidyltransferase domain-containing protein [Candidatus Thermoplasmatota archaeon]|nr:nucleotidyltransferase domain-containing protein [Candidatus Thermoplasmatota archaeon]
MSGDEADLRSKRRRLLEAELARIQPRLRRPGVRQAFLVGSLARGEVGITSDLDLVIVQETSKRFLDRAAEWTDILEPRCAVDLFVYTPEEFATLRDRPFLRHALADGRSLLEA